MKNKFVEKTLRKYSMEAARVSAAGCMRRSRAKPCEARAKPRSTREAREADAHAGLDPREARARREACAGREARAGRE